MVLYPALQKKVQMELDDVVGRERLPSFSDRPKLRYTEATLNEIYRHGSNAPLGLPHAIMGLEDVDFRGYTIPKDARVIINLHGMHNERKYWRDPGNFRPDRFLDDHGNLKREDGLIPYGLGM
ncbi:Methyl farnesoate epoxidase [Blattella germanica]|nr:Methyl farnesoate epoxidase [Blattella germanica]